MNNYQSLFIGINIYLCTLTDSQTHSCIQIYDSPPSQFILITSGKVLIASSQLDCRSHLAGGFGYIVASQAPHSQQTSTPASVSRSNMFHKHEA